MAEAKRHTLAELIERYTGAVLPHKRASTQPGQGLQLAWWNEQLGSFALADLTPALLSEYRDKLGCEPVRSGKTRGPATVNRYLAALSHAFTIAIKEWQ